MHEAVAFVLGDALHGHARHHGDDFGHVLLRHRLAVADGVVFPCLFDSLEAVEDLHLFVAIHACLLELLLGDGGFLVLADLFEAFFQLGDFTRHVDVLDVDAGTGFVQGIDGLVGQVTVAEITVGELHAGLDGLGRVGHQVVVFVAAFDVVQDFDGLGRRCWLDENLLETALQGSVFLDILAVLVQSGGADALQLATCQGGLEHVAGIKRAVGVASAHEGVDLVDEEDDVAVVAQLVEDAFDAFLKLATVFGAGHDGADVEHDDALAEQGARHAVLHDADGQAFGDGRLAHARLTY